VLYGLLYIGKTERAFKGFLDENNIRVLTIGVDTASVFTKTKLNLNKKGIPLSDDDLLIAASCLEYGIPLYTLNKKHFERVPNLRLWSE
jgi:predicted nucleic acid-binding protein